MVLLCVLCYILMKIEMKWNGCIVAIAHTQHHSEKKNNESNAIDFRRNRRFRESNENWFLNAINRHLFLTVTVNCFVSHSSCTRFNICRVFAHAEPSKIYNFFISYKISCKTIHLDDDYLNEKIIKIISLLFVHLKSKLSFSYYFLCRFCQDNLIIQIECHKGWSFSKFFKIRLWKYWLKLNF